MPFDGEEVKKINIFLWPMVIPLAIPLAYTIFYKKDYIGQIIGLMGMMFVIVLFYSPLISLSWFGPISYFIWKTVLFIGIPLLYLVSINQKNLKKTLHQIGVKKTGIKKSVRLGVILIPVMIAVTITILWVQQLSFENNFFYAIISFFESLTEEFLFRGVLFLFVLKKTNTVVALITSIACFVLSHPQHFHSLFLISTMVQALLTVFIVYRSKNLTGAWILHGSNRIASLVLYPLLL